MNRVYTLIKNIFKIAKVLTVDDTPPLRFGTVAMLGKNQKVMIFTPYGLMHNPPVNSLALVFSQNGQESNGVAFCDDPKNRILKSLEPGEVAIGNYETGHYLFFDQNGKATLVTDDLDVLVTDNCLITAGDMDIQVDNDIVITAANITATCTEDLDLTAANINLTATTNIALSATNVSISATTMTHDGTNVGNDHYHTQGNDSDGDSEQDTSGPN